MVGKRGGELRADENGEGIQNCRLVVTEQSQGCKVQQSNTVGNTVIMTMHSAGGAWEILERTLRQVYDYLTAVLHI